MYSLGKVLLIVLIVFEQNPIFVSCDIIQWSALLFLGVLSIKDLIVLRDDYTKWLFLFMVLCISSILWSSSYVLAIRDMFFLAKIWVVMTFALKTVKKEKSIGHLIDYMIFGILISEVMIFPYIVHAMDRLYITVKGSYFSANTIGPEAAFGILLAVHKLKKQKENKLLYIGFITLSLFTILKVGSRSSLAVVLVGLAIDICNTTAHKKIRNIVMAGIGAVIVLWAILNIPCFYNTMGFRIVDFLSFLQKKTVSSDTSRSDMLRLGLIIRGGYLFARKPLFGYGAGNYQHIYASLYDEVLYSHNNCIEILVGTGIIGFIVYYAMYFKILFRKSVENKRTTIFGKELLISLLVLDMMTVTYNVMNCHLILLLAYACTHGEIGTAGQNISV